MLGWIKPLISIMMSSVSEVVDYQLRQIYSAVKAPWQYLRINTEFPINVNSDMDHIIVSDHLRCQQQTNYFKSGSFEVKLDGWIKYKKDKVKLNKFITEISDHCLLYCELIVP